MRRGSRGEEGKERGEGKGGMGMIKRRGRIHGKESQCGGGRGRKGEEDVSKS